MVFVVCEIANAVAVRLLAEAKKSPLPRITNRNVKLNVHVLTTTTDKQPMIAYTTANCITSRKKQDGKSMTSSEDWFGFGKDIKLVILNPVQVQ